MTARCSRLRSAACKACAQALLCAALVVTVSACGASSKGAENTNAGDLLTVYASMPLQGPDATTSAALANGEKLALAQAGGHVGLFKISYRLLDDSGPNSHGWDSGDTSTNAKIAAQDESTIAYLGDYDSAATAISLPITNALDILQISPASPYVGLTSSTDAGQDEPDRFYPSNTRTFGRLSPGDKVEALAQARMMRRLGVKKLYVISDEDPFQASLAELVQGDAQQLGIRTLSADQIDSRKGDYSAEVKKVLDSGAGAVFYSGGLPPKSTSAKGPVLLWRQLHAADPKLLLLGSSALVQPTFTSSLGPAAAMTYLSTPTLPNSLYPPLAQRFFADYKRAYGKPAPAVALYGYEAMEAALASIHGAGKNANNRLAVVRAFFAIRNRNSVLGRYSVMRDGDTTLSDYGIDRVVGGRPVFAFEMRTAPSAPSASP